jgi:hypothetical protein
MLVMEVSGIMKTATQKRARINQLDDGDWLYLLLANIHEEVANQPSPQAVERIRGRLLAQIQPPARVAA